jgi:hypothetical protein
MIAARCKKRINCAWIATENRLPISFIFLVYVFWFRAGVRPETLQTSLLSERTVPLKKARSVDDCHQGFHRRPCLIQSGNASEDFVIRLERSRFLPLATDGIKPKTFQIIVVESDFPLQSVSNLPRFQVRSRK